MPYSFLTKLHFSKVKIVMKNHNNRPCLSNILYPTSYFLSLTFYIRNRGSHRWALYRLSLSTENWFDAVNEHNNIVSSSQQKVAFFSSMRPSCNMNDKSPTRGICSLSWECYWVIPTPSLQSHSPQTHCFYIYYTCNRMPCDNSKVPS